MDGGRAGAGSGSASASGSTHGPCPFLRRQSVKRSFSTMAERERRTSSPDSLFVSPEPDPHYNNTHPAQRPTNLALPSRDPRRWHYPGDGLDFRRPVTTAAGMGGGSNVIDLTLEDDSHDAEEDVAEETTAAGINEPGPSRAQQRLPNFPTRNIIDVESDLEGEDEEAPQTTGASPQHHHHRHNQEHHRHWPDMDRPRRGVAATDARSTDSATAPADPRRLPPPWNPRSITPHPNGANARGNTTIDLTEDDDDDIVITDSRPRVPSQLNVGRPVATAGTGTRGVVDRLFTFGGLGVAGANGIIGRVLGAVGNVPANRNPNFMHQAPQIHHAHVGINMDYLAVGFAMGEMEPPRPETPKYEPPPAAEPGFTRSPNENDEVVCPNCGDELCMGDNDVKQQVWVVKACGHAYCGECAHNRTAKKPKGKGKARVETMAFGEIPPMKKCQVIGCGVPVHGPKQMLRVYVDG